jgi:HEAT repeat protein
METRITDSIAALVAQMPEVDTPGKASKFTGPHPDAATDIYDEILKDGRKAVRELIHLVRAPSDPDFQDYRAGYLLHGLAMYVGDPGKEAQRRLVTDVLTDALGRSEATQATRALLIRELQYAGNADALKPLGKFLSDEELCEPAAQAMLAIGGKAVGERFLSALRSSEGKRRATIVQALGTLREAGALKPLLSVLQEKEPDTRLAAAWAVANIGAPEAINPLLQAAEKAEGWERIQANNACLILAERLVESGKKAEARRLYAQLRDTRTAPAERHIREAAERALGNLG